MMRLWPGKAPLPYGLAPGRRVYAVGDIHGRADLLDVLLDLIIADAADYAGACHLVFLGDYHNRGLDGAAVFRRLCDLPQAFAGWDVVYLKGNHELALQEFLAEPEQRQAWLHWGGYGTLESYGIPVTAHGSPRRPAALAAELQHTMAACGHDLFLDSLVTHHRIDGLLFVHAGVRPGVPWERQGGHDLMFIRETFLAQPHGLPYRVVFGHTPMEQPLVQADKIGVDTGAYRTGRLTAGVLEGVQVRFVHT